MPAQLARCADPRQSSLHPRFAPGKDRRLVHHATSIPLADRVAAIKARLTIATVVGRSVKLMRKGREFVGCCPFHSENTPSFTVAEDKGFAHCFGCGWHGDMFKFVQDFHDCSFLEAVHQLEAEAGSTLASAPVGAGARGRAGGAPDQAEYIDGAAAAAAIWPDCRHARGTIVAAWLSARGLDPEATGVLDVVRFHPACPTSLWRVGADRRSVRRTAPAMVAPIFHVIGGPGARRIAMRGVHITYLSGDGRSKAPLPSWTDGDGRTHAPATRRIWGALAVGCSQRSPPTATHRRIVLH